jgi:hypothetical protein
VPTRGRVCHQLVQARLVFKQGCAAGYYRAD